MHMVILLCILPYMFTDHDSCRMQSLSFHSGVSLWSLSNDVLVHRVDGLRVAPSLLGETANKGALRINLKVGVPSLAALLSCCHHYPLNLSTALLSGQPLD